MGVSLKGFSRIHNVFARFGNQRKVKKSSKRRPPNALVELSDTERHNRKLLLSLAELHGPIFRVQDAGQETTCVVGLPLGRRFLKEHADALRPITLDLTPLFPLGFLRQLEGSDHQKYRKTLINAVNCLDHETYKNDLGSIASMVLTKFCDLDEPEFESARQFLSTLSTVSTGFLLRIFFGARMGSENFETLSAHYHRLGPHGLVWNIKQPQIDAFSDIRDLILELASSYGKSNTQDADTCVLQEIVRQDSLDETMIGNLIYMVEMGRYDVKGLFRWIAKYAASQPDWMDKLAQTEREDPQTSRAMAKAFVQETLRMDQSERLMRDVKENIEFDDMQIPKDGKARVCMWESHKDANLFADPFTFIPDRFLAGRQSQDEFSPFGLDHHQCPFSTISVAMGIVLLTTMARDYKVAPVNDGETVRGAYHWEPAPNFSISLTSRNEDSQLPKMKIDV